MSVDDVGGLPGGGRSGGGWRHEDQVVQNFDFALVSEDLEE